MLHLVVFVEVLRHEAEGCQGDATERVRLQLEGAGFLDGTDVELGGNIKGLESLE